MDTILTKAQLMSPTCPYEPMPGSVVDALSMRRGWAGATYEAIAGFADMPEDVRAFARRQVAIRAEWDAALMERPLTMETAFDAVRVYGKEVSFWGIPSTITAQLEQADGSCIRIVEPVQSRVSALVDAVHDAPHEEKYDASKRAAALIMAVDEYQRAEADAARKLYRTVRAAAMFHCNAEARRDHG
jgi:hypothetical protein